MRVGFLGGTFDPIHFGHLNLALQMLEIHKLDEVIFCPTSLSPHKEEAPPISFKKHRKAMVEIAIAPIPQFSCLDLEIENEGPSYTIDTIRALKKQRHSDKIYLILGEDALFRLSEWKDVEELLELAPPLVGSRLLTLVKPLKFKAPIEEAVEKGMTPMPLMDISSTDLRKRLQAGLYCGHLIPLNVLDYISANKLYFMA